MVGQKKLISKINTFTIDTFPKSLILEGEHGSGRHLITKYIANKFNLKVQDITDTLTLEKLDEILHSPIPYIYYIDGDKITSGNKAFREENLLLKFLEEPLKNSYIILGCENSNNLLGTITNRCIKWNLEPYSKIELEEFTKDGELLTIANTPGKILEYAAFPIKEMITLISRVFKDGRQSSLPSSLNLANKIAFEKILNDKKELVWEKDKYPWMIFADVLLYCAYKNYLSDSSTISYNIYILTKRLLLDIKASIYVDKDYLFENYFLNLWKVQRGTWNEFSRY